MSTEEPSPIVTIRHEMKEILEILNRKLLNVKNYHNYVKKELSREESISNDIKVLIFEREKLTQKNEELIQERNILKSEVEKEKKEIEAVTNENKKLKIEIEKNEERITELKIACTDKIKKQQEILDKIEYMERLNKEKNIQIKKEANLYRKYMGLDIIPLQESIIQIIFAPFSSSPTVTPHLIINFTKNDLITDISPEVVTLERVNNMFIESKNFYIFLKNIRETFKTKIGDFI